MRDFLKLNVDELSLRVRNRESEHREFKSFFDNKKIWKYAKTMAAFANRDGGVIFFGIKDRPREVLGVKEAFPDELVLANFLKEYFEPEIKFTLDTTGCCGRTLLFVLVEQCSSKPVICRKKKVHRANAKGEHDAELLREGAIYYRYSSANHEIKYTELRQIIDERVQKVFKSLVQNIELINEVGFERAAVVDAENLTGDDKKTTVYVTSETARNINWIRKGRFSENESEAEKALFVTREIEVKHGVEVEKPVDPGRTHTLTKTDLTKGSGISNTYIDAVLWKLNLLNNSDYHLSGRHGKNRWHKFTQRALDRILGEFPLDMKERSNVLREIRNEYNCSLKSGKVI